MNSLKFIQHLKKHFFIFICIFLVSNLYSQQGKLNFYLLTELNQNKIGLIDVIVKSSLELDGKYFESKNCKVIHHSKNIYSIRADRSSILNLAKQAEIVRIEKMKNNFKVLDDTSIIRNNVLPIHNGLSPIPQMGLKGKNVVIGVIDTGIDFGHPDFKDSAGNTRIKHIWDQKFSVATNTPQPYNYGQEWDSLQIMQGLCNSVDNQYGSHGTKVSGVAAGNGITASQYKGIAPKADIIVVALDFNNSINSVLTDAVKYIFDKATAMGKACVINCSLGDYYGSHDGKDLQAQLIDSYINEINGRAMVAAAGNGGELPIHLGYTSTNDTSFTWITNNTNSIFFDVYADSTDFTDLNISIGVSDNNYNYKGNFGFRSIDSSLFTFVYDTIYNNGNRIGTILTYTDYSDGVYTFSSLIQPDSLNYLWSIETAGIGKIDSWNFDFKSTGLPSINQLPAMEKYKRPDTLQTICSSFQCSNEVISVANYVGRKTHLDSRNLIHVAEGTVDSIYRTSSFGPTRDLRLKPDIAASGENIITVGERGFMNWLIANQPHIVTADSMHMIFGGTSAAAPIVAGFAALYFEAFPNASNEQLKQDIINCSKTDQYTGSVPNYRWGNGKLDAYGAITCSWPQTVGLTTQQSNQLFAYPIPFQNIIHIPFQNAMTGLLQISDISGRIVYKQNINTKSNEELSINLSELSSGIYLLTINGTSESYRQLVIKE